MATPSAIEISEVNFNAILSEAGRKFNMQYLRWWCENYGMGGYFLRDECSPLDCELFTAEAFLSKYAFLHPKDERSLFRTVVQL